MNIKPLLDRWLAEADQLRGWGAESEALVLNRCGAELGKYAREWAVEPLTLQEAAEESGLSYGYLQRVVATGEIPNAGEKGSPRIRRCDLPRRKLETDRWRSHVDSLDPVDEALARRRIGG